MNGGILDFDFRSIRRSYTCSSKATIMNKRLGRDTFAFLGRFPIHRRPTLPSPYKQSWMRVFRLFCEFQLCIGSGVGKEGDLQKEALFYEGTQKFTEKY